MRISSTSIPEGCILQTDVVVIGAGPAGITIATELAAVGHRVMLLESGPEEPARRHQRLLRGTSLGVPFPFVPSRRRGFGGASGRWRQTTGLRVRPLDIVDFESSPARPGAAWPFGREVLEPYYRRSADRLGLSDVCDPVAWFGSHRPTELVWPGGPEFALFQFVEHDVITRQLPDLVASRGIELVTDATVTSITVSATGTAVESLGVRSRDGGTFGVRARCYVLAAGGIENSRMLLESPGATGAGVGNEHDQVGRYFMDHISMDCGVVVSFGARLDVRAFAKHTTDFGRRYQPMWWLGNEAICHRELLNAAFWVNEIHPAYLSSGVDAARRLRDGLRVTPHLTDVGNQLARSVRGARDVLRLLASRVGLDGERAIVLRVLAEQVPDRASRITLDDRRDEVGRRRVALDWRLSAVDLSMVRRHQDVLAGLLEERGIGTIVGRLDPDEEPPMMQSNYHHLGGTRMHADPRRGVVDADCRVHGAPNLFVVGGSVFPAGGYLNPTLTILALAHRVVDTLRIALTPPAVGISL